MVGSRKKLREGLANLFKARGAMTPNTQDKKPTNSFSRTINTREARRDPPNAKLQESTGSKKAKQSKKTTDEKMEQGRGPLLEPSASKKLNGKLNGTSFQKERNSNKNRVGSEKHKSKQSTGDYLDAGNNVQSSKKVIGSKNLKHKTPKVTKVKEPKLQEEPKKQSTKMKQKGKNKEKIKTTKMQQTEDHTKTAKKRKLLESNNAARKKFKVNKVLAPSSEMEVWENSESLNESDTTEEYSDSVSFLESDYDSDLAETLSYDDYESYDDSDEYSLSTSDEYSDHDMYEDYDSQDDDNFQEGFCSDPDYELPKEEAEDLIVHKGLAVTYKLEPHHGAEFDESNEESHIVELPKQIPLKTIKQHGAYNVEHLRTLELNYFEKKSSSKATAGDEECPSLVPIEEEDEERFKLWTSGVTMDDEMFSDYELVEDSDESSTLSYSDVNRKYLQRSSDNDSSSDMEEVDYEESDEGNRMQAFIVHATDRDSEKGVYFQHDSSSESKEHQSVLEEILERANNRSNSSNVKVVKANMDNYVEKYFNDYDSVNSNEASEVFEKVSTNQQGRNTLNDYSNEIDSESVEKSFNSTHNLNTTEDNISAEMDADFVDSMEETAAPNDSIEALFELVNEADNANRKNNFDTKFCNSIDSYYVLVLLKSQFFIYGTVKAKLIAGSTEIYGYRLKPGEMVTLHSPRGCSAVPLKPTTSLSLSLKGTKDLKSQVFEDIQALSDEAEFNPSKIKRLLTNFDPLKDAILVLTRNDEASKIKHIFQQHMNENIFPAYIPHSRPFFSSETMLDCMVNTAAEYALQIPPKWLEVRLKKTSKVLFVGGKSVGKSTFLRYLLNKNLADFPRILLIDLDIGQPEIFVPQTVSCALREQPLLGPGLFWSIQPDKAYAVGHTNLISCAHDYIRAVLKLLEFCNSEPAYKDIPWLINTMGYNKGFGGELISVVCAHLQPTDIIQLQSNKAINNFDLLFEPCVVASIPRNIYNEPEYDFPAKCQPNHELHIMPSAILQESRYKQEWQMSAKDMRYLMMLARLSAILPDSWVNQSETFCHDLEKLKIVNLTSRSANETETLKSLESNLVYLCYTNASFSKTISNADIQRTDPLECLGIGIVRGIDYHARKIFIMPAMPERRLREVNCLALGEMPLPSSLLAEQNPDTEYNIPFVQVMNDAATSRAVKQFFYRK